MEKMISVINDNLKSVVDGIKMHKTDTETALNNVRKEMSEKIEIANTYKMSVEDAKNKIGTYEKEIIGLESDLEELNKKFSSLDFQEILAAGNKEINRKIAEKKVFINEKGQIIIELTDKAHEIKNELLVLKNKKEDLESVLNKSRILEKYYESRINEICDYASSNPDGLESFADDANIDELKYDTKDFDGIDIDNVVDGKVFEEIDEISIKEPGLDEIELNVNDDVFNLEPVIFDLEVKEETP